MITALRDQLAADLEPVGVTVHREWADRLTAPCLVVSPPASGSYITSGPQFGGIYTIAMDVLVLVPQGSPSVALAALESLTAGVLANTVDWSLSGVDAPGSVTFGSIEYLGAVVHLSKPSRL